MKRTVYMWLPKKYPLEPILQDFVDGTRIVGHYKRETKLHAVNEWNEGIVYDDLMVGREEFTRVKVTLTVERCK